MEFVDSVGDATAEADVVDEYGFDAVGLCDLDGTPGSVHEVRLAVCGELDDLGSSTDDCDGLVVSESSDVETHDGFVVVSVIERSIDGFFDRFE